MLALPFAYYMARVATSRRGRLLFIAVLLPLWASYLARVYAWIVILHEGRHAELDLLQARPAARSNIGYTNTAMWLVFSYIWLPFMIIPVYARARTDPRLAARGVRRPRRAPLAHVRDVVLPLALPGMVAGSIFTFSLTLGDFITPLLVGGANSNFIGNVIYANIGTAEQPAVRGRAGHGADRDHDVLPLGARLLGAFEAM